MIYSYNFIIIIENLFARSHLRNIGKALVSKCRHGMGQPGNATDEDHVSNQQCNAGFALVSNAIKSMFLFSYAMPSLRWSAMQ